MDEIDKKLFDALAAWFAARSGRFIERAGKPPREGWLKPYEAPIRYEPTPAPEAWKRPSRAKNERQRELRIKILELQAQGLNRAAISEALNGEVSPAQVNRVTHHGAWSL